MPRYPQALHELPMVCFLGLICRSVSGLSHSGHSTNFLMNPSSMSCSLFASCDPLTM
uniref:Uncharacterized protein n=1 Tax=Anguilla anguilla TaxID=7936 RepID=A0A0E9XR75_ANGAN